MDQLWLGDGSEDALDPVLLLLHVRLLVQLHRGEDVKISINKGLTPHLNEPSVSARAANYSSNPIRDKLASLIPTRGLIPRKGIRNKVIFTSS